MRTVPVPLALLSPVPGPARAPCCTQRVLYTLAGRAAAGARSLSWAGTGEERPKIMISHRRQWLGWGDLGGGIAKKDERGGVGQVS